MATREYITAEELAKDLEDTELGEEALDLALKHIADSGIGVSSYLIRQAFIKYLKDNF